MLISLLGTNSKPNRFKARRFLFAKIVITGFNTDIEYEGVTYHVQTEDKGVNTPLILSLVYDRGTILASKRSPYDDLIAAGFDEKVLTERLQKQHKLMCAAVRGGRIEDLKRMTMKESALRQKNLIAQKEVKSIVEKKEPAVSPVTIPTEEIPIPSILKEKSQPFKQPEISDIGTEDRIWDIPLEIVEEPIIEVVEIVEEEMILPAEAVEIISDLGKTEPTVTSNELKIELLSEAEFKGGERRTISVLVHRGSREKGLSGVNILVKILGSSFRPLIFHAKTDSNGVAIVHLQLPHFRLGRAAILIKAMNEGEETELRRVIRQG